RAHLLVPRAHQFHLALGAVHRAHQAIDAVARIAVDTAHAPLVQTMDQEITDGGCHCYLLVGGGASALLRGREETSLRRGKSKVCEMCTRPFTVLRARPTHGCDRRCGRRSPGSSAKDWRRRRWETPSRRKSTNSECPNCGNPHSPRWCADRRPCARCRSDARCRLPRPRCRVPRPRPDTAT